MADLGLVSCDGDGQGKCFVAQCFKLIGSFCMYLRKRSIASPEVLEQGRRWNVFVLRTHLATGSRRTDAISPTSSQAPPDLEQLDRRYRKPVVQKV
jgi:hypothetical protein